MLRPVHGGCWWALAFAVVASVVWAGPAAAETTIAVDAGYAGAFVPGQEVPVRVRISADRLLRGTLEVGIGNIENGTPVAIAVEVPGGSDKQFLVTARSGLNQNPDVVARLRQGDRLLASGQVSIRATPDTELVGLLPGAIRGRAIPGVAPLAVDVGTARFAAVGEGDLEQAPASLGPLSTLAADVDELSRLSPGARFGVLRWIDSGGRLLVDSARGQAVPGLPDAWQPGTRGRAAAGLGEVVAADGAIAAGRWSGLVEPSSWGAISARFAGGQIGLASALATDAGLRTPEIGWLVGFLVVYVVAVGPLLFLAVRRSGRPELAWVAVPLVAVVFSTGSYFVGRNLRKTTQLVHATVMSSGPAGPVATSYVGVFSRSGETATVGFPAGWSSGPGFAEMGEAAAGPSLLTRTAERFDALLPLEVGQFGMAHASGPVPGDGLGGLEVTATADPDGRINGTVRNPTSFTLSDVAVFVGSDATLVGLLAPGERRPFSVANFDPARMEGGGAEFKVWGALRMPNTDTAADFALWQAAQRGGGLNFTAPNAVVAAGWTREFQPDITVGGRTSRPKGRTLVLGRQGAPPAAQGPTAVAGRREIVRDPAANRLRGAIAGGGAIVRFVLPEGADTSKLVLKSTFGAAELWQDGSWRAAPCDAPICRPAPPFPMQMPMIACPPGVDPCPQPIPVPVPLPARIGQDSQLTVPASSVKNGVIYARAPVPASLDGVQFTLGRLS